MGIHVGPGPGQLKCEHARAKATPRCKDCGAITNSHRVEEMALYDALCPGCGDMTRILGLAVQCHKCWLKDPRNQKQPEEM